MFYGRYGSAVLIWKRVFSMGGCEKKSDFEFDFEFFFI